MDSEPLRFQPAPLVIDDPWERVSSFFAEDGSVKYDNYIATGVSPKNRIVAEDIFAINQSMRARSSHEDWQRFLDDAADLPELAAISPDWDLCEMSPDDWDRAHVPQRLEALFASVLGPGIRISRATKVLHIKRPALIPVCDDYVLQLLGIPGQAPASGVAAIVHLREEGRRNLRRLQELRNRLQREHDITRTLARIIDVLIWGSHPDTWVARRAHRRAFSGPARD